MFSLSASEQSPQILTHFLLGYNQLISKVQPDSYHLLQVQDKVNLLKFNSL